MLQYIYILFFLFCFISCKNETKQERLVINDGNWVKNKSFINNIHAIRMWADMDNIYFSDSPHNTISVYNYNGVLIKRLGKKGPAPWENGTLWGYSPDEDSSYYWVYDYEKQLVKKYNNKTGEMINSMKIYTIDNVQYIGESKLIVPNMNDKTGDFCLSIYDIEKKQKINDINISHLIGLKNAKPSDRLDFVLNGNMCIGANKNYSTHYCYNAGYFFVINNKNLKVSVIKDVRNYNLPKTSIKYGAVRLDPELVMVSSAAIDSTNLYALTSLNGNFSHTDKFFIDIYDLVTKKYLNSMPIEKLDGEQRPVYIAVNKKSLVIYFEKGTVVIYNRTVNKSAI